MGHRPKDSKGKPATPNLAALKKKRNKEVEKQAKKGPIRT